MLLPPQMALGSFCLLTAACLFRPVWPKKSGKCRPDLERPLVAYSGMTFELDCQACAGGDLSGKVSWEFQANGTEASEPVDSVLAAARRGLRLSDAKRRLTFSAIRSRNAGKYLCRGTGKEGALLGSYDVTVLTEPFFNLVFESSRDSVYPEETVNGTTLFTHWNAWTECNHCGEWGEKFRLGHCYARYRVNEYPGGVPCRSNVLLYTQRLLFSRRRDEKIIRECEMACPKGKEGNSMSDSRAMETYNVDFDLGRPTLPPTVESQVYYVDQGGSIQLLCPGGGVQSAIRWENASRPIVQTHLRTERIAIDHMHALRIEPVLPGDQQIYTCYHDRVLVASITLKVVQPVSVNKKVKSNLMFVGIAMTGLMGLVIWASVCKNRKRHSFRV